MKIEKVKISLSFILLPVFVWSIFSFVQAERLLAYDEHGGHIEVSVQIPERARGQALVSTDRIFPGGFSQGDLDGKQRYGDQEDHQHIEKKKNAAAVLSHEIGKPPQVTNTCRESQGRQDKGCSRRPDLSRFHLPIFSGDERSTIFPSPSIRLSRPFAFSVRRQ